MRRFAARYTYRSGSGWKGVILGYGVILKRPALYAVVVVVVINVTRCAFVLGSSSPRHHGNGGKISSAYEKSNRDRPWHPADIPYLFHALYLHSSIALPVSTVRLIQANGMIPSLEHHVDIPISTYSPNSMFAQTTEDQTFLDVPC